MFLAYIGSQILEIVLFMPIAWKVRKFVSIFIVALTGITTIGLLVQYHNLLTFGILFIAIFRIVNMLRILKARMHKQYLYNSTRRTTFWLVTYQIILIAPFLLAESTVEVGHNAIWLYALVLLSGSLIIFLSAIRNIRKTRYREGAEYIADKDLPTVTVAIPARNETPDLEDCIRSILTSDYPKFEVIVLDDCSEDKTPDIIRDFAQDGVRFVPGSKPLERWLAKNQAYEKLGQEASGELILFCGVDVQLGPVAIRALVTAMLSRKKEMISIMPRRLSGGILTALVEPMRYWWELALPRRPFNRPAVASACWLIRSKTLQRLGGFAAVSHSILPEGYFARELVKTDKYTFIRADDLLNIQSKKNLGEQRQTAIRTAYPLLRRRPEWVLLASGFNLGGLVLPFLLAISTFWTGLNAFQIIVLLSCSLLLITHVSIVQASNPTNTLVALVNLPFTALTELFGYISMFKYEFGTVEWKGRDINTPVMHVIPKLPRLSE